MDDCSESELEDISESMPETAEGWKDYVQSMLDGINGYNPENIDTLEPYVEFQAGNEAAYDFEANLCLMKLYQFQPSRSNATIATQILLKALTNLPSSHFTMLNCVLPQNLRDGGIQQVIQLHSLLESCQFTELWEMLREGSSEVLGLVTNFEGSVKNYVCSLIDVSYQSVSIELLKEYLGGLEGPALDELIQARSWHVSGDMVHIRHQEEHIKPKKILAKIDFDSVSGILTAVSK